MKPTYEELQQQLENAKREFRSADITMQNLEAKCEKLAAENAIKQEFIKTCFRVAADGSSLDGADIQELGERFGLFGRETYQPVLHGYICGREAGEGTVYVMKKTPSTDAFLAEVKREATDPLEKEIEGLKKQLLMSVGDIRDLIDYNPETGVLTAKVNFSGRQAGSVIGSQTWQGYYAFSLFGKKCFAHRLAWLLHYGEWPSQPIDHINGIKTDNSIKNLRLCSLSQNQFNKPTQKNNTTGVKGVYWNKRDKRYVASVQFNGKKYSAGHHKDIESAKEAVMKLREKLAGEFTNHGEFELAAQLRQVDAHHCPHCGGVGTCSERGCTATDQMLEAYRASKGKGDAL